MRDILEQLTEASAALSRESDELNAAIEDFEERLEPAGTEVWLLDTLLGYQLGFSKVDGRWCVALRHEGSVTALLKAPRKLRVEAAARFEDLASLMLKRVNELRAGVAAAKQLVKEAT